MELSNRAHCAGAGAFHCPLLAAAFLAVILLAAFTAKTDVVAARVELASASGASLPTDVDEEKLEASK